MFNLVLQTVEKQEKCESLTAEVLKPHCVSNCFSPDWQLWRNCYQVSVAIGKVKKLDK